MASGRSYYARNAARVIAVNKAWNTRNPGKHSQIVANHNAKRRGASGSHTAQEWREKCELFAYCCVYCGERKPLERDHNIPLSKGGTNDIMNILPACRSCNVRKHARTAVEFIAYRAKVAA